MKYTVLAAAIGFGFSATAALAGEGNGEPFPLRQAATIQVQGSILASDTGSDQYPDSARGTPVRVIAGGVLPTESNEGPIQTANSLPPNFEDGTPAVLQAINAQRYFAGLGRTTGAGQELAAVSAEVPVVAGGLLPTNGSDGPVQTANSLPRGFEDGTPAYEQAKSLQRYWATHASPRPSISMAMARRR